MTTDTVLTLRALLGKAPKTRADYLSYFAKALALGLINTSEYRMIADADWDKRARAQLISQKRALLA